MSSACRIGTRASPLARAQAEAVGGLIEEVLGWEWELRLVSSKGDKQLHLPLHQAQEPGLFTRSLEQALMANTVDLAVHSLKDLPLAQPRNLPVIAVPQREVTGDLLLVRESHHDPDGEGLPLRSGTRVGTSAPRRQAFLISQAPDMIPLDLRGNVGTRMRKLEEGWMDAQIMAAAPFQRMDMELPEGVLTAPLEGTNWPSAPGQGALAIQIRSDWDHAGELTQLDHPTTRAAVTAERDVLATLGGGCGLPLGVHVTAGTDEDWSLTAQMAAKTWRTQRRPLLAHYEGCGNDLKLLVRTAARTLKRELTGITRSAKLDETSASDGLVIRDPDSPRWLVAGTETTASRIAGELSTSGIPAQPWTLLQVKSLLGPDETLPKGLVKAWQQARWVVAASARTIPFLARLDQQHPHPELQWSGVGPATARALRAANLPLHLMAPDGTGVSLAQELIRLKGVEASPVLMPGAQRPSPEGPAALEAAGVRVVQWPVYQTMELEVRSLPRVPLLAGVILLSPSAVNVLAGATFPDNLKFLALGPTTGRALEQKGLPCHGVAQQRDAISINKLIRSL